MQLVDPNAELWSNPYADAVDFGPAGDHLSPFQVAPPQVARRVYVYDPASQNYAWIDAAAVGPSDPPAGA